MTGQESVGTVSTTDSSPAANDRRWAIRPIDHILSLSLSLSLSSLPPRLSSPCTFAPAPPPPAVHPDSDCGLPLDVIRARVCDPADLHHAVDQCLFCHTTTRGVDIIILRRQRYGGTERSTDYCVSNRISKYRRHSATRTQNSRQAVEQA